MYAMSWKVLAVNGSDFDEFNQKKISKLNLRVDSSLRLLRTLVRYVPAKTPYLQLAENGEGSIEKVIDLVCGRRV